MRAAMVFEGLFLALVVVACVGLIWHFARALYQTAALAPERELAKLTRPRDLDEYPGVTVIIPARNEARNIAACLDAVMASDYPQLSVIVADDDSSDKTSAIVRARADSDPRIRLLSVPDGGEQRRAFASGKSYVLWQASQLPEAEKAPWLLFLDADTRLRPDAIWKAVAYATRHRLGAFSGSGIYENPSVFGEVMETMLYSQVFQWMPIRAINRDTSPKGWLNGQMILIGGDSYRSAGGHRAIGEHAFDDLALGHHLKRRGIRYRFLPAAQLYRCFNYVDFEEAMSGWTRLLAGGTPWLRMGKGTFFAMAAELVVVWALPPVLLFLCYASEPPAPSGLGGSPIALLWAQVAAAFALHALHRAAVGAPLLRSVLYPAAAWLALAAVWRGYRARFHKGAIEFRGRTLRPDLDHDHRDGRGEGRPGNTR